MPPRTTPTDPPSLYERLLADGGTPAAPRPPRASAAVVPWRRDAAGEVEVYWVERSRQLPFMGGWHAFPGGGLSRRHDPAVPLAAPPRGADGTHPGSPATEPTEAIEPDLVPGLAACALRELFEETGLLLTADGPAPAGLEAARRRLLAGELAFADLAAAEGWRLTAAPLVFAGRWLTPPLAPLRFDNRFFLLEWQRRRTVQPTILPGELVDGDWIRPAAAIDRWQRGEVLAAPPILHILRVLAEAGPVAGLPRLVDPEETNLGPFRRIEFRPGVLMVPLATPTLPPATHTNAYLLGTEETVLVDPATPFPDETERLLAALEAARRKLARRVSAVWLTHHHPDHVGAAEAVRRALGVPVLAHRRTAEQLARRGLAVDGALADDQRIELAGEPPFPLRVLHTPGHASGHLAFLDETHGSLIAGDLTAGIGTVVIDPPDGDMESYLGSLERMIELAPKTLFPGHGPAVLDAVERLRALRDHRLWREERVLAAWQGGTRDAAAMVPEVYDDLDPALGPLAARQVTAHLDRLRARGRL